MPCLCLRSHTARGFFRVLSHAESAASFSLSEGPPPPAFRPKTDRRWPNRGAPPRRPAGVVVLSGAAIRLLKRFCPTPTSSSKATLTASHQNSVARHLPNAFLSFARIFRTPCGVSVFLRLKILRSPVSDRDAFEFRFSEAESICSRRRPPTSRPPPPGFAAKVFARFDSVLPRLDSAARNAISANVGRGFLRFGSTRCNA